MGREIIFEVREKTDKGYVTIWNDNLVVSGRDDSTTYIAHLVKRLMPENVKDAEPVLYIKVNDESYKKIKERLFEYRNNDFKEINRMKATLEALGIARKNAPTLADFNDFSDAMSRSEYWLEENGTSRANLMLDYLNICYSKMLDFVNADNNPNREDVFETYKVAIIWNE